LLRRYAPRNDEFSHARGRPRWAESSTAAIGNGEPERRADGALDQADFAAMRVHEFGGDGEAETRAAGAGRALERLEQMPRAPCRKIRARCRRLRSRPRRLRDGR